MRRCVLRVLSGALAGVLMVFGCAGCGTTGTNSAMLPASLPPPDVPAVLSPGDELNIKFYYAPELSESQVVRPDGMITLQLVGEMQAAGLTPTGLQKRIEERFRKLIERSEVTVIVRTMRNRVVYVGGAVLRPRSVEMPGRLTALAAIMEAGGFEYRSADQQQVLVLREKDGRYETFSVDMHGTLRGGPGVPFYLQPRDIVYVARTRIADINQWIEQHVAGLIPQFGFGISHTSNGTTLGLDTSR